MTARASEWKNSLKNTNEWCCIGRINADLYIKCTNTQQKSIKHMICLVRVICAMACDCVCLNARRSSHSHSLYVAFVGSIYWLGTLICMRLLGFVVIRLNVRWFIVSHLPLVLVVDSEICSICMNLLEFLCVCWWYLICWPICVQANLLHFDHMNHLTLYFHLVCHSIDIQCVIAITVAAPNRTISMQPHFHQGPSKHFSIWLELCISHLLHGLAHPIDHRIGISVPEPKFIFILKPYWLLSIHCHTISSGDKFLFSRRIFVACHSPQWDKTERFFGPLSEQVECEIDMCSNCVGENLQALDNQRQTQTHTHLLLSCFS